MWSALVGSAQARDKEKAMREKWVLASLVILGLTLPAMARLMDIKFDQPPMINTQINGQTYYGHDEISTAYGTPTAPIYTGENWMADDFADYVDGPVVRVEWWGSYLRPSELRVGKFLIEFLSDLPEGPNQRFSRPLAPMLSQIVTLGIPTPGSGLFTETLVAGSNPSEPVYHYDAQLKIPFRQEVETVYWLKIVALVEDQSTIWGWHNRDYTIDNPYAATDPDVSPGERMVGVIPGDPPTPIWHFQDDAVRGQFVQVSVNPNGDVNWVEEDLEDALPQNYIDGVDGPNPNMNPPGIGVFSKDLAFRLHTPEPLSLSLLALGGLALVRKRR